MWNKLTHLVKHRSTDPSDNDHERDHEYRTTLDAADASATTNGSVMSRVYEQHPNLSVFHSGSAVEMASPSPPASPSKGSKRSIFKRSLKAKLTSTPVMPSNNAIEGDVLSPASSVWTSPSPAKVIPKRIRASLQIDTFTAQSSKGPPAAGSAPLPVQPHTPTIAHVLDGQPSGTGSIRSILRDRNTPGTGQSVRFFSRDAYRVITPNASEAEIDENVIPGMDPEAFLEKLRNVSPEDCAGEFSGNATRFHSALMSPPDNIVDVFSPPRHGTSSKSRKPPPFQPRHPPRPRNSSDGSSHSSHSRSDSGSLSASNSQSLSSLTIPVPPADMSNLFDISHEHELAEIPVSVEGSLRDDAIEEVENEYEGAEKKFNTFEDVSMKTIGRSGERTPFPTSQNTPSRSVPPPRDIVSPEGTVFHSAAASSPAEGYTLFHSLDGAATDPTSATIFFTPDISQFKINNNTAFFTPEPALPASPVASESNALVPASKQATALPPVPQELVIHSQEDLVASLRGQLALQQQLAAQYEMDLTARDELVTLLTTQLNTAEEGAEKYRREVERRQSAMRVLRRKVGELEKICRGLEEEVERSREESFDRSVMDEASGGALVALHASIGQLKGDLEKAKEEEMRVCEERDVLRAEVEAFSGERARHEEVERDLRDTIEVHSDSVKQLEDRLAAVTQGDLQDREKIDELQVELARREEALDQEHEKYRLAESAWSEEKAGLATRLEARLSDQNAHDTELKNLRRMLSEREEELSVLKAEVEAQWGHAERADEQIKGLEGEKEALTKSVQALHGKIEEIGGKWKEGEVKRAELEDELNEAWAVKEEVEHERDRLIEDVNFEREHAEQLTQSLQHREAKLDELKRDVTRLEPLLRSREVECTEAKARIDELEGIVTRLEKLRYSGDAASAELQAQVVKREQEAEQLREQLSTMKREHRSVVDEQGRRLREGEHNEVELRRQMEDMLKQREEGEIAAGNMKKRLAGLMDDVERLRRQVHDLQQESADKEVKLLQLTKARVQDKEDNEGLNIALDSKQQELELLKRKLGLKGTGGSTPAPTRVGLPDLAGRRQSVAFATPSASRPRPASVTGVAKTTPATDTPIKTSLSTSVRGNAPPSAMKVARTGSMGPPPPKRSSISAVPLSASTSSLARSTSSRSRSSALPVGTHRRSSSAMSSSRSVASPAPSEDGEKENAPPVKSARRTMVPS